ncbi:unnamed protein product [Caenorhabditis bovis]|uniref:MAM domain-containing protein n=1 Tax=Caenorhabditis bovis TaxID=2654633 RepID=A0A8S1E3T3_9PELO|nr:unnamed protein product [Caenorhabditis bovis]
MRRIVVVKFFLVLLGFASCCQPPLPLGYQTNVLPLTAPSPLQYGPTNGFASGIPIDQSAPIPPPPPPVTPQISDYDGQLEPINAKAHNSEITPYPGYIPPPPAASTFPTLINNKDVPDVRLNQIHQQSSNTYQSSQLDIQTLDPIKQDFSCPDEITTMTDFLICVQRLSTVTLDETNLKCDFEKDSGCRFKSISNPLSVGNFPRSDHYSSFAALASRSPQTQPIGNFVFFIEHRGTKDEFVVSTPIICQKGDGILKFDYWIVGNQSEVLLRVCTQNHIARSCTQKISYSNKTSTIAVEVVHPNSTFFELEIVASDMINPTIIVYDNIEYNANLCEWDEEEKATDSDTSISVDSFFDDDLATVEAESTNIVEATPTHDIEPLTIPIRPIRLSPQKKEDGDLTVNEEEIEENKYESMCQILYCDFTNDLCSYSNYVNDSMPLANWQLGNQKVGNPHTGVRNQNGGFLYVGTDNPGNSKIINYVLESPDLSINEDIQLSIDIYRRSNDITLQICLDTPFYCPYTASRFEKDVYWKEGEIFLIPKGTVKIFLRAIQWRRFKWLAIDNIKVLSDKC